MTDIEKLREIFVAEDVDDETRADNLMIIRGWEKQLRELDTFAGWKQHPVTQQIIGRAKKSYIDHSLLLARSRDITDSARQSLWSKQDAMLWFISLASTDVSTEIANINAQITRALNEA